MLFRSTVDLINGSTLTTLTSAANTYAEFSGGACYNCGVAINAVNNTAVITMGYTGGATGYEGDRTGVQVLNLASNTFNTPFGLSHQVSEDISIDSGRNLILSWRDWYIRSPSDWLEQHSHRVRKHTLPDDRTLPRPGFCGRGLHNRHCFGF